ncbi:MAG TPA: hypothetical protein VGP92_13610, partial [Acidimicrobiia bacterium]|nr:hypothetical protein [Acidimicrobiia bacterium]
GTEVPARFLRAAVELLRPGGVAVVMALDVQCVDGRRPLRELCAGIDAAGHVTARIPTRLNALLPDLEASMCERQPNLRAAVHVAVVITPDDDSKFRARFASVTRRLAQRWNTDVNPR